MDENESIEILDIENLVTEDMIPSESEIDSINGEYLKTGG
jgi:hypothetical protein